MHIAQVAPLYERVPPPQYGGTERIVHSLVEELVDLGHEVTLFASGDSQTSARLVAPCVRSLRNDHECRERLAPHVLMLEEVAQRAGEFDLVHFHTEYIHFPTARRLGVPHVSTLHGRLDLSEYRPLFREFSDLPLVSISESQRRPLPGARWAGTVHHGLPVDRYRACEAPGEYLAFLGRISPEKRVDRAVEIAQRTGLPLRMAAKIDPTEHDYVEREVRHLLDDPLVEYLGEIGDDEKSEFLGGARALLFPIDWPEPFGLAVIEALACGTPVIAYRQGAMPELIEDGVTGFLVDDIDGAVEAVRQVGRLSRARCREVFEERFTARRMALDYLAIYERLAAARPQPASGPRPVRLPLRSEAT